MFYVAPLDKSVQRRWSVRKTGEFGRRLDANAEKELHLPARLRQFRLHEPNLELAETRRYDQLVSENEVRKPSQDLELPRFNSALLPDQDAEETGESEGYVYPRPDDNQETDDADQEGYTYTKPDPVAGPNKPEDQDPTTISPARPVRKQNQNCLLQPLAYSSYQ